MAFVGKPYVSEARHQDFQGHQGLSCDRLAGLVNRETPESVFAEQ